MEVRLKLCAWLATLRRARAFGIPCLLLFGLLLAPATAAATAEDAQEAEVQFSRGLYALNQGDYHEAAQRFEAADAKAPGTARYLLYLGLAENRLHKYRRALEHLDRASELDASMPGLPYESGVAHMGLEEWEAARDALREAQKRQPRRGEVYLNLGVVEDRLGNSSEALSLYEKAVALDPGLEDEAAFYRGRTYLEAGMVDRAKAEFGKAAAGGNDRIVALSEDYLGRIEVAEAGPPERWDFTGYFAAVYDDNVVLNPEDPGVNFPVSDQEDVRAVGYAAVKFRPWISRHGMVGLGLGLYQSHHEDLREFDLRGIMPDVEARWQGDNAYLRAILSYQNYDLDNEQYLRQTSLEVRPGWRERNAGRTELVLRYTDENYEFDPRDADEISLGVEQYFYPWKTKRRYASATVRYAAHDAGNDFERKERATSVAFYTPLGEAWDFYAGLGYTNFDYENLHSFFNTYRRDDEYVLILRTTYDLLDWLDLVVEYRGTDHQSNIPFFDYERQTFTVGILARP